MVILISDVAEHFNCSTASAAKITQFLTKASNVHMVCKDVAIFSFCGVKYTLIRSENEWIMLRSTTARSTDLDDLLK
jgi:hypothetical protein